ncbi:MAG: hypothetical protein ABWY48_04485 [Pseudoxanthomonas sp.]
MRRDRILFFLLALIALPAVAAEEPAPEQLLAQTLIANRHALSLENGALQGEGADLLLRRASDAQFVLLGEDHGFAEPPRLAVALNGMLGKNAFPHLVIETGPYAAQLLGEISFQQVSGLVRRYPGVFPFFDWQEDAAMAARWSADKNTVDPLWGIDQEFILGTQLYLQRLVDLAPDTQTRAVAEGYLAKARAADARMVAQHDPEQMYLPTMMRADFAALRKGAVPAAVSLIDALDESAEIYRLQNTQAYRSNRMRSELMKRQFMRHYRAAQARGEALPRAMFRMGAYHMYRGLTPTNQFDIGNLASELAAGNGGNSLHVLVIPAGGTQNRKRPFLADESLRSAAYDAEAELEPLGAKPLLQAALPKDWVVIDLAPLRSMRKARMAAGPEFERLVFAYDLVVVIPEASAALDFQ